MSSSSLCIPDLKAGKTVKFLRGFPPRDNRISHTLFTGGSYYVPEERMDELRENLEIDRRWNLMPALNEIHTFQFPLMFFFWSTNLITNMAFLLLSVNAMSSFRARMRFRSHTRSTAEGRAERCIPQREVGERTGGEKWRLRILWSDLMQHAAPRFLYP